MRSSSRNSRELFSALGIAAAVSLLLGSVAQAGEHNFVLTAYTNGRGGPDLVRGEYAAADKALDNKAGLSASDSSTNSNNRCVSLAATKQLDAARAACDKAVQDAERERASSATSEYWARNIEDDVVAVALSNRAVVHWMSENPVAADADLKRAAELSPKNTFVLRNKSALDYSHTAFARLDVASK